MMGLLWISGNQSVVGRNVILDTEMSNRKPFLLSREETYFRFSVTQLNLNTSP